MTAAVDGRRLRGIRSRDAVVDALLELCDEGHLRPGAALIAERAGVSQSSVFRHFGDLEDLIEAAVARQFVRIGDRFAPPPTDGDLDTRIDALIAQRLAFHRLAGPAIRTGRALSPDSPTLHGAFTARRALFRRQVADQFASELAGHRGAHRTAILDALDAACSLEHIELLRSEQGYTERRTAAAVRLTLRSILRGATT